MFPYSLCIVEHNNKPSGRFLFSGDSLYQIKVNLSFTWSQSRRQCVKRLSVRVRTPNTLFRMLYLKIDMTCIFLWFGVTNISVSQGIAVAHCQIMYSIIYWLLYIKSKPARGFLPCGFLPCGFLPCGFLPYIYNWARYLANSLRSKYRYPATKLWR